MANPHPSRSKPCKIGRKHTGAPSIREKAKRLKASKLIEKKKQEARKRFNKAVSSFWKGDIDIHPAMKKK